MSFKPLQPEGELPKKSQSGIKRLVLDVLKLHNPDLVEFALELGKISNGINVLVTLQEVDRKTESIKVVLEGDNIDYERVKDVIVQLHASIHSIDQVVVGKTLIEDVQTPQDKNA